MLTVVLGNRCTSSLSSGVLEGIRVMYLIHLKYWMLCLMYILLGLQGLPDEPDDISEPEQVYGELEGVVDKLAKEAQRGTLPRSLFSLHFFFITNQLNYDMEPLSSREKM